MVQTGIFKCMEEGEKNVKAKREFFYSSINQQIKIAIRETAMTFKVAEKVVRPIW